MHSIRDIRRQITSVSSTMQITKAMEMVAASKMRKAQEAALALRGFAHRLCRMQRHATTQAVDFNHSLLEVRQIRKRGVILVAADKGLCGALNTNVFRLASDFDVKSTIFVTAGRKAAQFVARSGRQLAADFPYGEAPRFPEARAIAVFVSNLFLKREVDQVLVIATQFINT